MEFPNDDFSKNENYTQNELCKIILQRKPIKIVWKKNYLVIIIFCLTMELEVILKKIKNIIGKTKIVMLKPNIASSPNLRNNFKLEKVKDLKNLILSEKDKNRYILVKKDNSSNLSTILCKNI